MSCIDIQHQHVFNNDLNCTTNKMMYGDFICIWNDILFKDDKLFSEHIDRDKVPSNSFATRCTDRNCDVLLRTNLSDEFIS